MTQNKFEQLVAIYRAIDFKEKSREGVLSIIDDEQRDLLKSLFSTGNDEYGLKITQGNADALQVGETIGLEVSDPKISIGIVAMDIDDLLIYPKARIKEPPRYFVISENFYNLDQNIPNIPDIIERYRILLKLIALLKQTAAYLDEETGELVFIQDGKYELPIQFSSTELQQLDINGISKLLESFENDTHRDQKLVILAKSMQNVCNATNPKVRFGLLLKHFPELLKSFSEGYRLFVADFSYDKIINQLEAAKLEEIGKIHKVFSDIQNQILGIPVATIIVATQMKAANTIGYEFWVNTAVLVGCWVFAILSFFVLRNQLHTLNAIGEEIARKKQQMLDNFKPVEDLITKSFPFLEKRLSTQRWAFYIVGTILVAGLFLAHVVYFFLTEPAHIWILKLSSAF